VCGLNERENISSGELLSLREIAETLLKATQVFGRAHSRSFREAIRHERLECCENASRFERETEWICERARHAIRSPDEASEPGFATRAVFTWIVSRALIVTMLFAL
jgi:hypothetical protein